MKIFKQVNIPNNLYYNTSDKFQLIIHFIPASNTIELQDENGIAIEYYNVLSYYPTVLQYPAISGQENLSTGAINYNAFNVNVSINTNYAKNSMLKILVPPNFRVAYIISALIIQLDNLDELRGLL